MTSRPPHLTQARADRFTDQSVVDAYPLRWPYPPETFETLVGLMPEPSGTVLDVGTGTGDIARPLATRVGRVDAVDVSAPMLARAQGPSPWEDGLNDLIATYSTVRNYEAFDLVTTLAQRSLFDVKGRHKTTLVPFRQSVAKYIESFHSRSSLSRQTMPPGAADAFDRALRELVEPWSAKGVVVLQTMADMVWGEPLAG